MPRILSALVILPVVLGVIVWAPWWATLGLALAALGFAVGELASLAERHDRPLPRALMFVAAAVALCAVGQAAVPVTLPLLAALIAVGCALIADARPDTDVIRRAGVLLLPVLYLGLPLGAMVAIRRDRGALVLLLLLATTIVSDTAQYYGGRFMGRRPLAPRISPKKTLEGAVSGVIAGGLVLPLAGSSLLPSTPVWLLGLVGVVLVGLGIAGDLFESLLKRSARVKDASSLIPGHGGVLDRIDSLLFAAPFYYGFLRL